MQKISIEMLNLKKADAIFIDLRDDSDRSYVFLIDGGTGGASDATLLTHRTHHINASELTVISTHPDNDHMGGLAEFVSIAKPKYLIMSDPETITSKADILRRGTSVLSSDHLDSLTSALDRISDLKTACATAGTQVISNWYASSTPILTWGQWKAYIVGPTLESYTNLWSNDIGLKDIYNKQDGTISGLPDDSIDDGADTSELNNSSIMLFIEGSDGSKYLFTGDAGIKAINSASHIKDMSNLNFLDVPHHGSRKNVNSEIIEYFKPKISFISSDGSDKHPRMSVINKLKQVGSKVYSTCKEPNYTSMHHNENLPRTGYTPLTQW